MNPPPLINEDKKGLIKPDPIFFPAVGMTSLVVCCGAVLLLCVLLPAPTKQQQQVFVTPGPPDKCLAGPYHKSVPSPEEEEFDECLSWQNKACCNVAVPRTIDNHKAYGLYNYSWDLCGALSPACETFIKVGICIISAVGVYDHILCCMEYAQLL